MNEIYKAAIYCRLSKDDEQSGDSVSIETQKMMLTKYCVEHDIEIYNIYVDDGYSGLNFNRPSFKRMIKDLEERKFNTVITKDLSRLGRDYIQTGYYIDIYFATQRVRYIAINDGIDTNQENNDIAPFKNILNDMYAKDISKKIKSAKRQRAQNGLHISSQTPYGYKVNPYNRNQLIVDEEVAPVVKLIFRLAEEGKGFSEISRILEAEKHISPSVYKVLNGDTRFLKIAKSKAQEYVWTYQTVRAILNNPVYVGDMVNHKVEVVNYKTKERLRVPREEQIIVPNTHEAIIEREQFNRVNERISKLRKANHKFPNIFKGVIFCEECGTEMQLILSTCRKKSKLKFRCPRHALNRTLCTHNHFICYNDLIAEIRKQLESIIENFIEADEYIKLCEKIAVSICSKVLEKRESILQNELIDVNKRIKEYYKTFYEKPQECLQSIEFDELLKIQKAIIKKIGELNIADPSFADKNLIMGRLTTTVKEYICKTVLSETAISKLIRKIEIGHLEERANGVFKKITIFYVI